MTTCEPETYSDCVAVPDACESDADCADDMSCLTRTYEECSTSPAMACAPDQDCPPPPEPECQTVTESACVPNYMLPCQQASDCGAGFECVPMEECGCSGSSGTGTSGSSGGATPAEPGAAGAAGDAEPEPVPKPEPPSCTCTPTGVNGCTIIVTECTSADQCPDGWSCEDNPQGVACSTPDGTGTGSECGSTEPDRVCLPPYIETVVGVSEDGPIYASDDNAGEQAGFGQDPTSAPGDASGEGAAGDSGAGGGCSIGGPGAPSFGWLALFSALALGLRRRRS
jgi:MYXO-CTERM domain-containing protein